MSTATVDLTKMNTQELLAHIAKLEAAKAEADKRAAEAATFSIKIGRSGTVSVSGFGRYGISLYSEQWDKLSPLLPAIMRFKTAYAEQIAERVSNPLPENTANEFKPLKLKADSTFATPGK